MKYSVRCAARGTAVLTTLFISIIAAPIQAETKAANQACLDCHSDADNVGKRYAVKAKALAGGPHIEDNGVTCVGCHVKAAKVEDVSDHGKLGPASCDGCHEAGKKMRQSSLGRGQHAADSSRCRTCHGPAHAVTHVAKPTSPVHPSRQPATCGSCHKGPMLDNYLRSVHGQRLKAGKADGPTCSTCHGAHDVGLADVTRNPGFKVRITKTCAKCHDKEARLYEPSVHGVALLKKKIYASASCVDCHLSHQILPPSDPRSSVHRTKVVRDCAACHADAKLIRRFHLPADVVTTYALSYHGRAGQLRGARVATCSSCHEQHAIFRSTDPRSSVHPKNLVRSCGRCHPGASASFASHKIHLEANKGNGLAKLVQEVYVWVILIVIGGMALHNLLDLIRKLLLRARAHRAAPHVVRMTRHDRLIHALGALSFTVLAYTGFALLYPTAWWVTPLNWISATEAFRSTVHRAAGLVLAVLTVEHLGYILFTARGRRKVGDLWPRLRDVRDLWHALLFFLGRRQARPRFGRYSYVEKAEYWALVWGTAVMLISGAVLWFENTALGYISLSMWDVFKVVHRYEAILAGLAILVWHFYHTLINPDEAPMSLIWITGDVPLEELKEQRPDSPEARGEELRPEEREG